MGELPACSFEKSAHRGYLSPLPAPSRSGSEPVLSEHSLRFRRPCPSKSMHYAQRLSVGRGTDTSTVCLCPIVYATLRCVTRLLHPLRLKVVSEKATSEPLRSTPLRSAPARLRPRKFLRKEEQEELTRRRAGFAPAPKINAKKSLKPLHSAVYRVII